MVITEFSFLLSSAEEVAPTSTSFRCTELLRSFVMLADVACLIFSFLTLTARVSTVRLMPTNDFIEQNQKSIHFATSIAIKAACAVVAFLQSTHTHILLNHLPPARTSYHEFQEPRLGSVASGFHDCNCQCLLLGAPNHTCAHTAPCKQRRLGWKRILVGGVQDGGWWNSQPLQCSQGQAWGRHLANQECLSRNVQAISSWQATISRYHAWFMVSL